MAVEVLLSGPHLVELAPDRSEASKSIIASGQELDVARCHLGLLDCSSASDGSACVAPPRRGQSTGLHLGR